MREGEYANDFILSGAGGTVYTFDELIKKSQHTLVYVWGAYLRECREYLPEIQKAADELADKIGVLGISMDILGFAYPFKYITKHNIRFLNLIDCCCTLSRIWKIRQLPLIALVNRDGVCVRKTVDFPRDLKGWILKAIESPSEFHHTTERTISVSYNTEIAIQSAINLLGRNKKAEALAIVNEVAKKNPGNAILQAQAAVFEKPESFYP